MAVGQYYIKNDVLYYDDGSGFTEKGNVRGLATGAPVKSSLMAYMGPSAVRVDPETKKPTKNQPQSTSDIKDIIDPPKTPGKYLTFGPKKSSVTATSAGTSLRYPNDPPIGADTDYVVFEFFEYSPPFKNDGSTAEFDLESLAKYNMSAEQYTRTGLSPVILYMPEDISTGFKTNWTGKNFSNIGAGVLRTAGGEKIMNKLKSFGETVNEGADRFTTIAGAQIISAAIGKITGESVSLDDIFSSTRGVILNPNTELLFTGLDLRNFSLNYKLVPRSANEANQIEGIIKTFKMAMLPYANSGAEDLKESFDVKGFQAGFIKVPDLVKVTFMSGNDVNKHVPQYKMCALTQVDISYTPDGTYATTVDGRMVAYQMSLNFQETKLIYREDIKAGY